jgi:hypothetical protein
MFLCNPTLARLLEWRELGTDRRLPTPETDGAPDQPGVRQPALTDPNWDGRDRAGGSPDPRDQQPEDRRRR